MKFEQMQQLSRLRDEELTAKLVGLAREVLCRHDANTGLTPFDWENLQFAPDGWSLCLEDVAETELTDDVRRRNYHDYAGVIYCVCTAKKSSEAMSWDAGSKIQQPVLREIVLTLCGRNKSVDPLIEKLRVPYTNEKTFFDGYTTVDEKEASEAYAKAEQIKRENLWKEAAEQVEKNRVKMPIGGGNTWGEKVGIFVLMVILVGAYKACKMSDQYRPRLHSIHVPTPRFHGGLKLHAETNPNLPVLDFSGRQ